MSASYMIALCDILGFSEHVGRHSLQDVVEHSVGWFRKALNHSILQNQFPEQAPLTSELHAHPMVGVAWFSDTILLYTKADTDDAIRHLLSSVAWLIFETVTEGNTKVRAGIAYGEAFIDPQNSIFVGKPIIEAYHLESVQQWAGAALTDSAVNRLPVAVRTGLYADWWVVPWPVPLKGGAVRETLAVNWSFGVHHPSWRLLWSKEREEPNDADYAAKKDLCEKFVNTKRFHEAHCVDCRPQ